MEDEGRDQIRKRDGGKEERAFSEEEERNDMIG